MAPTAPLINDGNVVAGDIPTKAVNGHKVEANGFEKPSAVFHRSLHSEPLRVVRSKGNYLHLSNGQKIFDATGGAAVSCLGHGNERVAAAVADQMSQVAYCHSLLYGTSATEDLARTLIDSTGGEMARVFVISSGSEATEAALKMARQYHLEKSPTPEPERVHFIARQQSYHGTTLGALAVGGHVARRAIFEPMLAQNSSRVSPCYAYRGQEAGESDASYVARLEAELDAEFQRIGPSKVAAFIAEPVVGAALGCVPFVPGYFAAMRRVCDKYGALLIFDEIMCGCGRIGPEPSARFPEPIHAWQDPSVGVTPDIQTMGKGLGGGFQPVACVMANHRVVEALQKGTGAFSHGQTYQGHPVACRAALEVQRVIREENLVANVRKQGALLESLLREKVANHWAVGNVRGKGLFWGIEFVADKTSKTPFAPSEAIAMGVHELALQPPYNITLYPGSGTMDGKFGDHLLIGPAYNVTEEEIRHIVEMIAGAIDEFFRRYSESSK